ncbi:hypothetical protein GCM10017783_11770 [Deinococcus piscis]|uniref:Uncharacterized protein n=1 Tax=Deinococcus piscis TaxID=394230 RepID=A0ABQ3K7F0_9DEIO|nr:hypothetical protein GCM10017783_11770 [Deinococcus piscis]
MALCLLTLRRATLKGLVYLEACDGILYAGDSFANVPDLLVTTELHPLFPMPTLASWNAGAARSNAALRIELNGLQWLALGHGKSPFPRPRPLCRRLWPAQSSKHPQPGHWLWRSASAA